MDILPLSNDRNYMAREIIHVQIGFEESIQRGESVIITKNGSSIMKTLVRLLTISFALMFVAASLQAGKRDPVAVLFQVKGNVEYSKDGKKWRKVRRNKFLFQGYQIRSLDDGSGKITVKTNGTSLVLKPNTTLEVTAVDLSVINGGLEESEKSNQLVSGLIKKFSRSQSYTTVRRSANKKGLSAVREVVLADNYPYMVWDNLDPAYNYKLQVGDQTYDVPAVNDEIVKVKIEPFTGKKEFKITALKGDEVITEVSQYKSRGKMNPHTVSWLEGREKDALIEITAGLEQEFGEDTFMLGTYYEKVDMWVAAMEHYRKYLQENPDDIEMTPYLFRVYKKLKLEGVYKRELNEWTQAMAN